MIVSNKLGSQTWLFASGSSSSRASSLRGTRNFERHVDVIHIRVFELSLQIATLRSLPIQWCGCHLSNSTWQRNTMRKRPKTYSKQVPMSCCVMIRPSVFPEIVCSCIGLSDFLSFFCFSFFADIRVLLRGPLGMWCEGYLGLGSFQRTAFLSTSTTWTSSRYSNAYFDEQRVICQWK